MEMTPEQKRRYLREKEIRSKRIRKARARKRRNRLLFLLELFCLFGMILYLADGNGRSTHTMKTDVVLAVSEQELLQKELSRAETEPLGEKGQEKMQPEEILLVNKRNKLPEEYQVQLVTLEDGVHQGAKEAYQPLCDMLKAGRREGLSFEICSAYRSTRRQQELFDEDMAVFLQLGYSYARAYEEVAKETMPPGYSEHATGLAFDIVAKDYQMLDAGQEDTLENQWLQEHCAEYGFILRYPEGKEEITEISYESWHFRYVGVEAALYITEHQLTLEEYLEL